MKVNADIKQNVTGADAIVLLTEWQEFKEIDPKEISDLVTQKIIIDSRNLLNKNKWEKAGFKFIGNGYN
jgi:UDPglucose 6-dehydrogenase